MKKKITICLIGLVLMLALFGGFAAIADREPIPAINTTAPQTDPGTDGSTPAHDIPAIEVLPTESVSETTTPETQTPTAPATEPHKETEPAESKPSAGKNPSEKPAQPKPTTPKPSAPKPTAPKPTEPPVATVPAQTEPVQTPPAETVPEESEPRDLTPPITAPAETEPEETVPETTEPAAPEITYEFKRQVASYAAQYINLYRGSACTILPGMSQVAQYRAGQLTRNYGHSTADKRAALAHFEYGRYIDATEFGDDPSNSYWEADSAEAICAGFYGTDPKAMGKKIADLIRSSSGHWSYISSSEYSYMGVGVEYREGTEYGWYCCVMVGSVNYG